MASETEQNERFQRGRQRLMEVEAEGGERVVRSLEDVAPDLGRYVVESRSARSSSVQGSICDSDSR